ncbi:hypothetical protein HW49_04495 [Porphyromonadaceae bacterium COT-184 OH4590]|nr:hypothetical protein HW49_04495 [Porphyromonadaceae bacterium COT-184 OH4590]
MNNKWSFLWNPFVRIAGWQALALGAVAVGITGIIAKYAGLTLDGAIDAHWGDNLSLATTFTLLGIDLASVFVSMSLTAIVIARNFRLIDIIGTMTLARTPFLLISLLGLWISRPDSSELINNPTAILHNYSVIVFVLFSVLIAVWVIALMYNAFKVSTGAKGTKLVFGFIIGLIVAEVISKILIYNIL